MKDNQFVIVCPGTEPKWLAGYDGGRPTTTTVYAKAKRFDLSEARRIRGLLAAADRGNWIVCNANMMR